MCILYEVQFKGTVTSMCTSEDKVLVCVVWVCVCMAMAVCLFHVHSCTMFVCVRVCDRAQTEKAELCRASLV